VDDRRKGRAPSITCRRLLRPIELSGHDPMQLDMAASVSLFLQAVRLLLSFSEYSPNSLMVCVHHELTPSRFLSCDDRGSDWTRHLTLAALNTSTS
jgi:hypothetical protein